MGEKNLEKIRLFKRSVWQKPQMADWYCTTVEKPCISNERERDIIAGYVKGTIFDAGAGTGRISTYLKSLGHHVYPLDISREMLHRQKDNLPCTCGDVEKLPFKDNTFDTVNATWLLVHFHNWKNLLDELIRILKPEGRLLFEVSSAEHLQWAMKYSSQLKNKYDSPESFEAFITIRELSEYFDTKGVHIEKVIPYDYLNGNELLQLYIKTDHKDEEHLHNLCTSPEVIRFCCWVEKELLSLLPPGLSHKNYIIANKSEAPSQAWKTAPDKILETEDALSMITSIADTRIEEILSELIDALHHPEVAYFFRKIAEILSPADDFDLISIIKRLAHNKIKPELAAKLRFLIRQEFAYYVDKFVSSWHQFPGSDEQSVFDVPVGPVIEYELVQEIMKKFPEQIYLPRNLYNE